MTTESTGRYKRKANIRGIRWYEDHYTIHGLAKEIRRKAGLWVYTAAPRDVQRNKDETVGYRPAGLVISFQHCHVMFKWKELDRECHRPLRSKLLVLRSVDPATGVEREMPWPAVAELVGELFGPGRIGTIECADKDGLTTQQFMAFCDHEWNIIDPPVKELLHGDQRWSEHPMNPDNKEATCLK